jgi:hypothetical protein
MKVSFVEYIYIYHFHGNLSTSIPDTSRSPTLATMRTVLNQCDAHIVALLGKVFSENELPHTLKISSKLLNCTYSTILMCFSIVTLGGVMTDDPAPTPYKHQHLHVDQYYSLNYHATKITLLGHMSTIIPLMSERDRYKLQYISGSHLATIVASVITNWENALTRAEKLVS